jgi:hypothetical protein
VTSRQVTLQRPELVFMIHPIVLTTDDQHSMQLDVKHVPNPTLNDRLSSNFQLPVGVDIAYGFDNDDFVASLTFPIRYCQILENERLLLILANQENVYIYLDRFPAMGTAVRGRPIKLLKREKLGRDVLFTFDETKRVLVVCASVKVYHIVGIICASLNVLFMFSCNFTYLFSTRPSKLSRDRVVPLISHRGMVIQGSPLYTRPSCVGMKRWSL